VPTNWKHKAYSPADLSGIHADLKPCTGEPFLNMNLTVGELNHDIRNEERR
jgi:hypothetical protein